tara:strand:- start:5 stop:682 length:678 start_codon:yes stop_codon:yes gene_type:complete
MNLTIGNKSIKMKDGLYCLNDLHKASGGEKKNGPSYWLAIEQTKSFLETTDISVVKLEGRGGGSYAEKKAVYAYAMWISPEFQSHVIDAYDALVTGQLEEAKREATRNTAKLEAPFMTKAVKFTRDAAGKKSQHFHFSNEFNLINQVALGMTAKKYRELHGLDANTHLRDTLTTLEIACIEHLQRANTTMIEIGMDYQKRKCELSKIYTQRHSRGLIDEVKRLEY